MRNSPRQIFYPCSETVGAEELKFFCSQSAALECHRKDAAVVIEAKEILTTLVMLPGAGASADSQCCKTMQLSCNKICYACLTLIWNLLRLSLPPNIYTRVFCFCCNFKGFIWFFFLFYCLMGAVFLHSLYVFSTPELLAGTHSKYCGSENAIKIEKKAKQALWIWA